MSRLALNKIQNFCFDTLSTGSSFWSTPASIYDWVPSAADFPYVEIGITSDLSGDMKPLPYYVNTQIINIWSKSEGSKECNDIMAQVVADLTGVTLPNSLGDDFTLYTISRKQAELFKVEGPQNEIFRQGVLRFELRVQDVS